jgi:glutamine synthetase
MAGIISGFIERHSCWTADQSRQAREIRARAVKEELKLFRLVWTDPHGVARAKTVTMPSFLAALENGYNINVATSMLDASGARVFSSFVDGGGLGLPEMTGSPNLTIVPDPMTFRVLPWERNVGWILCDEHFVSGVPFHFSPRQLLRQKLAGLERRGMRCMIGLEVEWYLLRVAEDHLTSEHVGSPGLKGRATRTFPMEPGFSLHSETSMDLMHAPVAALADALQGLGLPLRSIEKEWGPGQLEFTFAPQQALEAADNLILFRTATRQVCRRMGYLASFMSRPALDGFYSSGWHLHQSLVDAADGRNLFMSTEPEEILSPLGRNYLGGLLHHAMASTVFANPTVNGYRRFRANSLAPDRVTWGCDHRGTMLRVLGAPGDPASRIENRVGEPAANPYLYILSQLVGGLDGIENALDPGLPNTNPYESDAKLLPKSLTDALDLLERAPLFKAELGPLFVNYYLKLKRTEAARFDAFLTKHDISRSSDQITEWEQNEYFDFF